MVLGGRLKPGDKVTVDADGDELRFEIEPGGSQLPEPGADADQAETEAAQPAAAQT
jgi:hypothetical protein